MSLVERKYYFEKLKGFRDKHLIKVVTGVRRAGKSTLLKMFADYLLADGVDESRIIFLNFEVFDNQTLCNANALYEYINERLAADKKTYIFLDEIQQVSDFQLAVDGLFVKENVDIYITGSNAKMLSGEIATLLSGRYVEINILPFSFEEFVNASQKNDGQSLMRCYNDYIRLGSFPYIIELAENEALVSDYVQSLCNTILLKDVLQRNKFADAMMLESVVRFLYDNIGNVMSTKGIADTMTSTGRKIDTKTVEKYINAVEESFFIFRAGRFDIQGKQHLKTLEKYYGVDMGMRNVLLGRRKYDRGRVLENVVYLELKRRYRDVYVGKMNTFEVDFVVETTDGFNYYQVAESVRDTETLARELRPLKLINDNYPKYLLTLDEDDPMDYDGIVGEYVLDWLMNK